MSPDISTTQRKMSAKSTDMDTHKVGEGFFRPSRCFHLLLQFVTASVRHKLFYSSEWLFYDSNPYFSFACPKEKNSVGCRQKKKAPQAIIPSFHTKLSLVTQEPGIRTARGVAALLLVEKDYT